MCVRTYLIPLTALAAISFATGASAEGMVRDQKVISSAGARIREGLESESAVRFSDSALADAPKGHWHG